MKSLLKHPPGLILLIAAVFFAGRAHGDEVNFEFQIPTIPDTPAITSVTYDPPIEGDSTFRVYTKIEGQLQMEACCNGLCVHECEPNCDFSGCGLADFYAEPDPRIVPNATCIPGSSDTSGGISPGTCSTTAANPRVFYYLNGDISSNGNVNMTYDSTTGRFYGDIPISGAIREDTITFYFGASDNRGNVVAQVPDINTVPCTTMSSWDTGYETPALNNCAVMNSYERCGRFVSGTPSCSSSFSLNDPENDTCDETGAVDESLNANDILGLSGGAGKGYVDLPSNDVVCTNVKLGGMPPTVGSSSGPLDGYIMVFFNPDIQDPNPGDTHMVNAFAMTYVPEAAGVDGTLVKVLWDGNCVTNPNTADPLSCKLLIGGSEETDIKITTATGNQLRFMAKNALPNGKTILGGTSGATRVIIATGAIDLSSSTPFWLQDMTSGMNIVKSNQTTTVIPPGCNALAAPTPVSPTCTRSDGTVFDDGTCEKADTQSTGDTCSATLKPSSKADQASEYRVYHSTTNDAQAARSAGAIQTITTNLSGDNTFTYNVSQADLKGETHFFFFTAVNSCDGNPETIPGNEGTMSCTVEDWVPPAMPTNLECATPTGFDDRCQCSWEYSSGDPSMKGFEVARDGDVVAEAGNVGLSIDYTDISDEFTLGSSYSYSVTSVDIGANRSDAAQASCTPEDLKPPDSVDAITITDDFDTTDSDFKVSWVPIEDESITGGGYNVYRCHAEITPGVSCAGIDDFEQVNGDLIAHDDGAMVLSVTDSGPFTDDEEYCYWVQTCDACADDDTCPSNAGDSNCTQYGGSNLYQLCEMFPPPLPPTERPLFPENLKVAADPEGGACGLTWDRVCASTAENGSTVDFEDCDSPTPLELTGYAVMRGTPDGAQCASTDVDWNPVSVDPLKFVSVSDNPSWTDTTVTNGEKYCYAVISNDMMNHFSQANPPDPVQCDPKDITPPDKPVVTSVEDNQEVMADIAWEAVTDNDAVGYSVYECSGSLSGCGANDFTRVVTNLAATTYQHTYTGDPGVYTYCVTATDPSGNESAVFESDKKNCGDTGDTPEVIQPPTNAQASLFAGGIKVWWTNSTSDGSSYSSTVGYKVYICDSEYDLAGISGCEGGAPVNSSPEAGTHDPVTDSQPFEFSTASIDPGDYYIGVTYTDGTDESEPDYAESTLTVKEPVAGECEDDPSQCVTITYSGRAVMKGLVECTTEDGDCPSGEYKEDLVAKAGFVVDVINDDSDSVIAKVTLSTTATQTVFYIPSDDFSTSAEYSIRLLVPTSEFGTAFQYKCLTDEPESDGYCVYKRLWGSDSLSVGDSISLAAVKPECASCGYTGSVMGDPNGDGVVNIFDLSVIAPAYGNGNGNSCYRAWADLNLDGVVNIFDLTVIKNNFAKQFDTSSYDPEVSSDGDNLPSCCKTGTCE